MSLLNVVFNTGGVFFQWSTDATKTIAWFDAPDGSGHQHGHNNSGTQIPTNATVNSVIGNYNLVAANLGVSSVNISVFGRSSGVNGSDSIITVFNDDPDSFAGYTATINPPGGSWTIDKFNALYLCLTNGTAADDGSGNRRVRWRVIDAGVNYLSADINFTLPTPVANTSSPTGVTTSGATLIGGINPNGATAAYPVSYHFEWGLTAAYGNSTTIVGGQTGSADAGVSAVISGLSPNTTYHYRIVSSNADVTTNGLDTSFTTLSTDAAVMVF